MGLENQSCQEEEDYIRENYSEQASWCNDAERDMIGDDEDYGLEDIGCK